MTAKKILTAAAFIVLMAALVSGPSAAQAVTQPDAGPVQVIKTSMADIDNALVKGPVLVEFETQECSYCKKQKPITQELAMEYGDRLTVMFVDARENRDLARMFQVSGVPQMSVVAKKDGNDYVYVGTDCAATKNIGGAKFTGLTEKDTLKKAIEAALNIRG